MRRISSFRRLERILCLAVLSFGGCYVVGRAAAEQKPSYRLAFTREPGAAMCPDASGVRAAVTAKLGYDPFRDDAPRTLAVVFGKSGAELRAQVELRDEAGVVTGARKLKSSAAGCGPLADDVAQAIAIAIDPLYLTPPPPASASVAPSSSASAAPTVVEPDGPPLPPIESPPPVHLDLFAGGVVAAGASPSGLGVGLVFGFGARRGPFSLALEGRVDRDSSRASDLGGEVRGALLAAMLVPCLHAEPFRACALAQGGAFLGSSADIDQPRRVSTPWAAVGGRVGIEVPILPGGALLVRLGFDILATLTRTRLSLHGQEVWVSPPVSGALSGGLVGRFSL